MNETAEDRSNYYLWFDTEFTSLELEEARLLQVALVVTDAHLQRVLPPERDLNLSIKLDDGITCSPWVEEHLAGLLATCRGDQAVTVEEADKLLCATVDEAVGGIPESISCRPLLAGNSIQMDWTILRRWLPQFAIRLNYRLLDVSSWKQYLRNLRGAELMDKGDDDFLRAWFPGEFNSGSGQHDAHFDVLASIAELNFYTHLLNLDALPSVPLPAPPQHT